MLGFAEAGYIPGAAYTLSTWYKKRELAKRIAVFFFGMFAGNAISPILASGILQLGGKRGIKGWQWLFLSKSCHLKAFIIHTKHKLTQR
jgi:MFS family permease